MDSERLNQLLKTFPYDFDRWKLELPNYIKNGNDDWKTWIDILKRQVVLMLDAIDATEDFFKDLGKDLKNIKKCKDCKNIVLKLESKENKVIEKLDDIGELFCMS